MPNYGNRDNPSEYVTSRPPTEHPDPPWIEIPPGSANEGVILSTLDTPQYRIITGDVYSVMDAAAQAAVDAQIQTDNRDAEVADQVDRVESVLRAFMLTVLDELNDEHAATQNAILAAAAGASNLAQFKTAMAAIPDVPVRTATQLRNTIRNKLGS